MKRGTGIYSSNNDRLGHTKTRKNFLNKTHWFGEASAFYKSVHTFNTTSLGKKALKHESGTHL